MKIVFVIKSLALHGGGAERVLAVVANGLLARGYDVIIATLDESDADDFYAFNPAIKRIRLSIGLTAAPSGAGTTLRRAWALRRFILAERPDVAVGFMHSAYIPLGFGLAGTGVPVVGSEHIVYYHFKHRLVERLLLMLVSVVLHSNTAISTKMRDGFPMLIRRKMKVIPNPVGAPPAMLADAVGGARKILLSVGRLEPQKDHRTLIAAFARLADRFPDWGLRIVGEGVLRPDLENQIVSSGIRERVVLPGATSDIDAEYSQAQLFAMSSSYESFGLATAEAMSHGLPSIGFADCPGTNELIVDQENGLLVDGPDRVEAFTEGLAHLMRSADERRRLAAAAPATVAPFATERVLDRWEGLLRAARAGTRHPFEL